MNIKCPKCRFKLDATAPAEGGSVEYVCPRCGTKFTHEHPVPEKPAPPEPEPEVTPEAPAALTPEQPVQQPVESYPQEGQPVVYYEEPDNGGNRSKALWIALGVAAGIVVLAAAFLLLPGMLSDKSGESQEVLIDTTAVVEQPETTKVDSEQTIKNEIESMWGSTEALTPEFQNLIKEDEKLCASTGDIYCIDYDLWTQTQDVVLEHQVVQVTDITPTSATAYARIKDYGGYTRTNKMLLVKLNGKWRVDEIIHDGFHEKQQLAKCIQEAKKQSSTVTKVYVNGVNVRLRTSPEINDYNIITDSRGKNLHPNKGDRLEYLGDAGDFYYISYRGINAYISKEFSYLVSE